MEPAKIAPDGQRVEFKEKPVVEKKPFALLMLESVKSVLPLAVLLDYPEVWNGKSKSESAEAIRANEKLMNLPGMKDFVEVRSVRDDQDNPFNPMRPNVVTMPMSIIAEVFWPSKGSLTESPNFYNHIRSWMHKYIKHAEDYVNMMTALEDARTILSMKKVSREQVLKSEMAKVYALMEMAALAMDDYQGESSDETKVNKLIEIIKTRTGTDRELATMVKSMDSFDQQHGNRQDLMSIWEGEM